VNLVKTEMAAPDLSITLEFFKSDPARSPAKDVDVQKLDSLEIEDYRSRATRITWFGHSAFLLEMQGQVILLDPMLGETPSPHPWLGSSRYSRSLPLSLDELPQIDAVLFSHDHYDHLDYPTIKKIKDKVRMFYVPLGLDNHLIRWGVEPARIQAGDWWESFDFEGITFTAAPARHFSGRGITDRNSTLWCSWIIEGKKDKIYFSGDGGYGPHFKKIGEQYGPFDLALLECGQYNLAWQDIHMMPEETVQAGIDVRAKWMIPIHWGAFTLSLHSWTDPIERASAKAKELGVNLSSPRIGEAVVLGKNKYPTYAWWLDYQ